MEHGDRRRVAVCICTYRRPAVLARLLARLEEVARAAHDVADVSVVVIDDDPARSAASVAHDASTSFSSGLTYDATASGNISVARNRALERGLEQAGWLALLDDDCLPEPGWLGALLAVQRRFEADIVSGRCGEDLPPGVPAWMREPPFVAAPPAWADGAELTAGYLKNMLVSAAFLRRTGLRFDEAFGGTGGEDAMFFYAAQDLGAVHRYAREAVVREQLHEERATLTYQLRRRLWYGNTEARTCLASGRSTRLRMAARGLRQAALGVAHPVARALRLRSPQVMYALAQVLQGAGRTLGAAGIWLGHR